MVHWVVGRSKRASRCLNNDIRRFKQQTSGITGVHAYARTIHVFHILTSLSAKHLLLRFLWKDRGCHPVRAVDDAGGPGGGSIPTPDFGDHIEERPYIYLVPSIDARSG